MLAVASATDTMSLDGQLQPTMPRAKNHCLRFLSGKDQGSEYVLDDPTTVLIGRGSDVDLVLDEGMVSRHHARIHASTAEVIVEDLGSTNGTFVNGDRVQRRRLQEGDRVLIGTTILKIELSSSPVGTKPPPPRRSQPGAVDDAKTSRDLMSGNIEEVGVPELVEMFSGGRQRSILELVTDSKKTTYRIFMADGHVVDARCSALPDAPAAKVVHRALGLTRGSFSVRPFDEAPEPRATISIPELLVDGLRKLDEMHVFRQRLPVGGEKLVLARPLLSPLSALDEADLDTLQAAHNLGEIDAVFDDLDDLDVDIARRLLALVDGGFLRKA